MNKRTNYKTSKITKRRILQNVEIQNVESLQNVEIQNIENTKPNTVMGGGGGGPLPRIPNGLTLT